MNLQSKFVIINNSITTQTDKRTDRRLLDAPVGPFSPGAKKVIMINGTMWKAMSQGLHNVQRKSTSGLKS